MFRTGAITFALGLLTAAPAFAINTTAYYLFDGDSDLGFIVENGVLTNTFDTSAAGIGYNVAIGDTIWLGDRDDRSAVEYDLAGNPTGNTSAGGSNFTQLLDGATGNGMNFGVECCGSPNSVTTANADWSGQTTLFDIDIDGSGIAYDPTNNTFYVSRIDSNSIFHFDFDGSVLDTFDLGNFTDIAALAYESDTDSFWGYDRDTNTILQFDRSGNVLDSAFVNGVVGNIYGGEMPVDFVPTDSRDTPAPAMGLFAVALAGLVAGYRRRKQA